MHLKAFYTYSLCYNDIFFLILEPITRRLQIVLKYNKGLTSIDSDDKNTNQETLGAYSFSLQIMR